jgi:hypothetical protein
MSEILKEKKKIYIEELRDHTRKLIAGINDLSSGSGNFIGAVKRGDVNGAIEETEKLKKQLNKILFDIVFPIDMNLKMLKILGDIPGTS